MTADVVIRAEGLGKRYLIGHQAERERYTALRDVLARSLKGLTRSARDLIGGRQLIAGDEIEEFWALKDVNFEIRRGEVVGIIGRNGAGKSTLLKVLSRITEPSAGRVTIKGRVASLLEVGTGFHPELSGRENIYLNGAILGMSRAEIVRKFDEIVDFSGVEKFLDTPVKRYSSGMYVRLAFAVAAHLDPEILVVDEVLAVGDAEFQKKCLGKMGEIAGKGGRTVLFVSHALASISQLCQTAILLDSGHIQSIGATHDVLATYAANAGGQRAGFERSGPMPSHPHLRGAQILSIEKAALPEAGLKLTLAFEIETREQASVTFDIRILSSIGAAICVLLPLSEQGPLNFSLQPGRTIFNAAIRMPQLTTGEYIIGIDIVAVPGAHVEMNTEVLRFCIDDLLWNFKSRTVPSQYQIGNFVLSYDLCVNDWQCDGVG